MANGDRMHGVRVAHEALSWIDRMDDYKKLGLPRDTGEELISEFVLRFTHAMQADVDRARGA